MTRVGFYVLDSGDAHAGDAVAARLAEKAWLRGHRVLLQVPDLVRARQLDELLWTFRDDSFLPHGVLGTPEADQVAIGYAGDPGDHDDLLINLTGSVLPFFSRFRRLAEIVPASAQEREQARDAWRFYRDRGYALEKHDLGPV